MHARARTRANRGILLAGAARGWSCWLRSGDRVVSVSDASFPAICGGVPPNHRLPSFRLQNLSAEPDSAYFSDGMTDEITTKLSKIQGIEVASHSSVAAVKGSDKNPAELGKALGVRYLLEGSVRKAGDQVRINVHLVDSTTGFQVWADDFIGEMKDVFSLQEQTALKIASSLNLKLTSSGTAGDSASVHAESAGLRRVLARAKQPSSILTCPENWTKRAGSMTRRCSRTRITPLPSPGWHGSRGRPTVTSTGVPRICSELSNLRNALWPSIRDCLKPIWRSEQSMRTSTTTRARHRNFARLPIWIRTTPMPGISFPGRWPTNNRPRLPRRRKPRAKPCVWSPASTTPTTTLVVR